jgi:flagellar hook-associated protein 3 FlgL
MILNISGATQAYLADLNVTQQQINQDTAEASSGLAVQEPSDDPAAVTSILQTQADIGIDQQIQSNLGSVTNELQTADSALQSAVQAVETAVSLAAQGGTVTSTAADRAGLAQQVAGLQQTLVGISQTTFNGRYIFSGDQDTSPMYQLDSSQPDGVTQLFSAPSTRVIVDATGTAISVAETAQQIFDAQNPDGSDASGNVFAAVNSLLAALNNTSLSSSDQQAAITQAGSALQSAGTYLNQQLAFYGEAEDRISSATDLAQKFQTQQQAQLSNLRDADIPTVAAQLTQAQTQEQAAISAEAQIQQQKNLFSYLV